MARISILGSGAVGTIVGKGFKELGNEVIFYDVDEKKVQELCNSGFDATTELSHAIRESDISFLCVPTPTRDGKIDLSYVKSATEGLAHCLRDKSDYHVVVVKSTMVPTTTEKVVIPLLEEHSGKKVGSDIGVCANPEFLTEIHRSWTDNESYARNFFSEERVVIGEFDKRSGDVLQALYEPLKVPIIRTDLKTAEMIKYVCNCALASRISYWNEIFLICERMGIDGQFVASVAAMDKRIGKYGTVCGRGFGGKCLPKDLDAFVSHIESIGYDPQLLKAVRDINVKISKEKGVRE